METGKKWFVFAMMVIVGAMVFSCQGEKNTADGKVVLRYANWNLGTAAENNLERRMLAAFMEAHPNITVEIDERISTSDWVGSLATTASVGNLPDVFMISDTPTKVANGWLLDITNIANDDPEFASLPASIRNMTRINGVTYTVPFAQFMLGYYVNRTLFNERNLNPPQFGVGIPQFMNLIRQVTDLNRPTIGLNAADQFVEWMPGATNPDIGFFTFDGTGYSLNSQAMLDAVRMAFELTSNGFTYSGLTDAQRGMWPGDSDIAVFRDGQMGMFFAGTWMNDDFSRTLSFDWDFIGVPGNRPVVALDIMGIASTTEHPEEAYLLAKWMGFGSEGYLRRMAIAKQMGIEINSLPVTTDEQVLSVYWQNASVPGLIEAYRFLDSAMIDGNKFVPGHVQARYEGRTGIAAGGDDNANIWMVFNQSINGNLNFATFATIVNTVANQAHRAALEALR